MRKKVFNKHVIVTAGPLKEGQTSNRNKALFMGSTPFVH